MSADTSKAWAAFVRSRAESLTEQAATRVDWAMTAFVWLVNAKRWAARHGDSDLAEYLNNATAQVLLHKWAA